MIAQFAMFPGCAVKVYLGTTLKSLAEASEDNYKGHEWILIIVFCFLLLSICGMFFITRKAKKKFNYYFEKYSKYVEQ